MTWQDRPKAFVSVFLATALAITACSDDDPFSTNGPRDQLAQEPFSFALDASSASRLRIAAENGTINITGVAGSDSVLVDGEKEVRSHSLEDAQAGLSEIEVESEVTASDVVIRTIQPDDTQGRNYTVNYNITAPRGLEIEIVQGNGIIDIATIDNSVSIDMGNGTVDLDDITGESFVNLGNGEIEGAVTLPTDGTIDWNLGNGVLELRIPTTTSAQFDASAANGSITVLNLQLKNQTTTETSVSGRLGDGDGAIELSVGNGTITVRGV